MLDEQRARQRSRGGFEDLDFVFAQTVTTVLTADEERHLAETSWQSRRRLALLLLWAESPELFRGVPPTPTPHRGELSSGLIRRLLDAEERAKDYTNESTRDDELFEIMRDELATIATARETLFERNLRLVVWIARGFLGKGLDLNDLFQEGSIVLLRSIDRYDPARGTRLSTFASHAIRLGLVRALTERGRPIRVPSYRMREVIDTTKARGQLVSRLGREPSELELEAETGLSTESIGELLPAIRPLASIDAPIAGSDIPLSDVLSEPMHTSPYDRLLASERVDETGRALAKLPTREQKVIAMRYGLKGGGEHTFEDIGKTLGLSRERVRQLEKSARDKMRNFLAAG
jgi:RNA polymerase nonessential primary-like sigma factor